jgi:hypothetical protein
MIDLLGKVDLMIRGATDRGPVAELSNRPVECSAVAGGVRSSHNPGKVKPAIR